MTKQYIVTLEGTDDVPLRVFPTADAALEFVRDTDPEEVVDEAEALFGADSTYYGFGIWRVEGGRVVKRIVCWGDGDEDRTDDEYGPRGTCKEVPPLSALG